MKSYQLCFVGPMLARHSGWVTTAGEVLAGLFQNAGYPVITTSSALNRYLRLFDIVRTLIRYRHNIDIVCLQVYGGPSFVVEDIASLLSRHFGHKVLMTVHGGAFPDFTARYPNWVRRVLGRADAICTPSTFLQQAVGQYGFRAEVIPNVIELERYPYRQRSSLRPRLLWMRTFHPIYNPAMAVRAFARLYATNPDAALVMAGQPKGEEQAIEQLVHDLGLTQAVRFAGFLDMNGKAREGLAADIYLNTNRIDNMPVSVVEACAMGLPVVSTNVGGIPCLLTEGETGLLVPNDDDEAMFNAICRLLDTPELAAKLSAQGRALAERSSWESVRRQWDDLFARLYQSNSL